MNGFVAQIFLIETCPKMDYSHMTLLIDFNNQQSHVICSFWRINTKPVEVLFLHHSQCISFPLLLMNTSLIYYSLINLDILFIRLLELALELSQRFALSTVLMLLNPLEVVQPSLHQLMSPMQSVLFACRRLIMLCKLLNLFRMLPTNLSPSKLFVELSERLV